MPVRVAGNMECWPALDPSRIVREHLSAEQFATCCDQVWSRDSRSSLASDGLTAPRHRTLLYAKQDHLRALFSKLVCSRARVVLVTAESDAPAAGSHDFPPQVAVWFATNAAGGVCVSLPLGLGNSYCPVTTKADLLAAVAGIEKTGLLYANFRVETNPSLRGPLRERLQSAEWSGSATFATPGLDGVSYARELASHRFALCPAGNGTDTHRMWEALYAGTIPVVERHPALEAFRDLPILFLESLAEINRARLEASYGDMLGREWNWDKLFLPWWRDAFERARQRIAGRVAWRDFLTSHWRRKTGAAKSALFPLC